MSTDVDEIGPTNRGEWGAFEEDAMTWLEAQTGWKIPRVTPDRPMEPYKAKKKAA